MDGFPQKKKWMGLMTYLVALSLAVFDFLEGVEFPEKRNFSLIDEAHQPTVVIVHLFFFLPENGWNFHRNVLFPVFAQNFPETAFLFFCCLYFLQSAVSFFLFVRISFKLQYQWGSMGAAGGISLKQHF